VTLHVVAEEKEKNHIAASLYVFKRRVMLREIKGKKIHIAAPHYACKRRVRLQKDWRKFVQVVV
jgi:hypothetical protein